jgi:hypothetical protein
MFFISIAKRPHQGRFAFGVFFFTLFPACRREGRRSKRSRDELSLQERLTSSFFKKAKPSSKINVNLPKL